VCARIRCAHTGVAQRNRDFFKTLVVNAVLMLDDDLNESLIGMKRVSGGSMTDSLLVEGVAFKKTFSYAGFEQQPKVWVGLARAQTHMHTCRPLTLGSPCGMGGSGSIIPRFSA
jgi:chaperonin GroEL (HSP60 family)